MAELSRMGRTGLSESEYEFARWRVERKRRFRIDLVTYVVINAFLIGVWAVTGFGYFWPGWVLAGWAAAGAGRLGPLFAVAHHRQRHRTGTAPREVTHDRT